MTTAFPHRLLLMLLSLLLVACSEPKTELERVKQSGILHVLTRNAATTYYEGPHGPTGLEYDLARGFAEELGVELKMEIAGNVSSVLAKLAEGEGDFAAAGLTATEPRQLWARFTPHYQQITQQLIYRSGTPRPRSLAKLEGLLEITARSSHEEQLRKLKGEHPRLEWAINAEAGSEELLSMVWDKLIDYTIADSNEVAMNQRYFPELRIAFDISEPQPLAWAFPKFRDESLFQAACNYFNRLRENGRLERLIERYYGHLEDFDYVGTRVYMRHMHARLPEYRALFEYSAKEFGLDWRLLAAAAYQESHWDPDAVSPTGVRGMMMLTRLTAGELGVEERTDPVQSIRGGALYLSRMMAKIPERIQQPDRSWLALAAYNIGYAHLEDARIITQRQGGDPDSWKEVKERLPLLRKRKWYENTKNGYARGNEAVRYVENIRSYYDILVWFTDQEVPPPPPQPRALDITNPAL
ncbi:MAG: membrane-bound lytic murein transglycosylase MltF [Gammaproteobacteria bacterium]|nr:membrane-bound lytic murein transglycosylase MltF [Gammaproteobacteria bacterium]MCW8927892.1 membrane-bound lytic murein transglycosylase MltF [Gammaproteobacteria bacterium]MCW8958674.1 membrane-bound lytic murein transglycosylase MltF [Gammaproteobacteria bacterium]MCW8973082.1 membrane-bound lytic murein transglycosylase MltF [Gammaproteobacteria bacterium]MCW8993500.1 membrane-bound lytic murein transglycosylase MltF [Gammaproteobacteria bacterium]